MERGQLGCNGQLRFGHKVVGPFRYPEGLAFRVNVKLDMQKSRWSNWIMLVTVSDLLVVVKSCSITGSWCSGIVNHIASRSRWSDIPCPAQAFPDAILWGTPGIMVELSLPAEMCSRMYFTHLFLELRFVFTFSDTAPMRNLMCLLTTCGFVTSSWYRLQL